ncbi:MAG: sulfite oxidase [Desulfobacterales bacterium]|jgi:DMSO/TMAO reductase YedYZ molybdopterin-dependent catalytic subunit|nr:sulfite oxidase [Desulfobacterales bacterium]
MKKKMRVMTEKPLNAETPIESLRTWTTDNAVFFKRNQGQMMQRPIKLSSWKLSIEGLVKHRLTLTFENIRRMPKVEVANTLECSGNSRSLLAEKASGNPWTIGGVGNAIWGGTWLKDLLAKAKLRKEARHVSFEGMDKPLGSAGIKFIRSIPLEKAVDSTLLAYEMNGQPLPLKHGYPLRALALGWTGANCVKWLHKITVLDQPHEGFFMDRVYRVFQKGEDPKTGKVVKDIIIKSIIVEPANDETLPAGIVPIRGTAYAGETGIQAVDISVDDGQTWQPASLIGPKETYAWRHWEYLWEVRQAGEFTIMARATDNSGRHQPETAYWNVLGYGNNGIREHAIVVQIT